jgi:hypothetical protein
MTILNNTSDGLHPELIVLFRTVTFLGEVDVDDLIRLCFPPDVTNDALVLSRLKGSLSRWIELGLFVKTDKNTIQLDSRFVKGKKESLEEFTNKLPSITRHILLEDKNSRPLWNEKSSAVASDFVKGISWLLAQDIYGFPSTWNGGAEGIHNLQVNNDVSIFQNDTRWNNLKHWARYLGFATGDGGSFQIDPTQAIKEELPLIFDGQKDLPAKDFLLKLSSQLPVFDGGIYRQEIEKNLNTTTWRRPDEGQLSMSLSFALQRLALNRKIKLYGKSDTGSSFRLAGKDYRIWIGFEFVSVL